MQTLIIAVLIVIAGLIGALLICATSLISRARVATTTLRRIEETLLAMNRVRAIDSAIKSAEPLKQSQTADEGRASFLTLRELKTMSGGVRPGTDSAHLPNRRKPPRTHAQSRPVMHPQRAPARESAPEVHSAGSVAHDTTGTSLDLVDSRQAIDGFAKDEPRIEVSDVTPTLKVSDAAEHPNELESSIEISWPGLHQQISNLELQKGADDALTDETLSVVSTVTHTVPAANGELTIKNEGGASQETVAAISPARLEPSRPETLPGVSISTDDPPSVPAAGAAAESAVRGEAPRAVLANMTASTSNDLDESRRKKKEQELMMIISSRRRRARAGR